jgi:murein DD-endopeptidase MepM/ murein hydrolase activator NlpD
MTPFRMCIAAVVAISGALMDSPAGRLVAVPNRGPEYGSFSWPVRGRVIRGFEPPPSPYEAGHRGIDIAAPFGSSVMASREGVVAFAGWVAGALFISIDHPDGVRTTYSWLSEVLVHKGQAVARREGVGRSGHGHPDIPEPHLHFGARVGSDYIDPMLLLEGADVSDLIHLAPLTEDSMPQQPGWSSEGPWWPWMRSIAVLWPGRTPIVRGPPVGQRT